jgi:hypothetical protein
MKREATEIIKTVKFIIENRFAEPSCKEPEHVLLERSKIVTRYIIGVILQTNLDPKSLVELQEEIDSLKS